MKKENHHLITNNYINIKRSYLEEVITPTLASLMEKSPRVVKTYRIAGKNVRLEFYSPILASNMSRSLEHHPVASQTPVDLTIYLWDSISTDTEMPTPWSKPEYFEQETSTKKITEESFLGVYLRGEETVNIYDEKNNTAYFFTYNANELPDWVSAAPVRTILHWFLSQHNIHLIHGATVGEDDRAVLLSAKGGSGKSTTALSCVLLGMNYLGDDYVAVEVGKKITAYSLYNSVKIVPEQINFFPELREKIWNGRSVGTEVDKGKAIVFLSEIFPKQIKESARLSAILIPRIKEHTRILPASKVEAMLALLPTTLFQLPLASSQKIEELKEIIAGIPCFFLELGPDVRRVPEIIKDFLKAQSDI